MNSNNVWELAEGYVEKTLSAEELESVYRLLEEDKEFAESFNSSIDMLNSLKDAGKQQQFRSLLAEVHEARKSGNMFRKALLYTLTPQFWRTAAIAAGVALITSGITYSVMDNSYQKSASQYRTISREVSHIKNQQQQLQKEQAELINTISKKEAEAPKADARYTGTGFAISNDGYFVTAYHVINDGKGDFDSVYIQNKEGEYFKAFLVNFDNKADIAIMKVEKKNFKFGKGEIPYSFTASKEGLGTRIYTLGVPKDEPVYSEGYISAKNGFDGNEMQYTLQLPAGHGQSGSPVIDEKGNITAMLTAIGNANEANTYAVGAKALLDLVKTLPNDNSIRLPRFSKFAYLGREQQIEKLEDYTFSVKVYKK